MKLLRDELRLCRVADFIQPETRPWISSKRSEDFIRKADFITVGDFIFFGRPIYFSPFLWYNTTNR